MSFLDSIGEAIVSVGKAIGDLVSEVWNAISSVFSDDPVDEPCAKCPLEEEREFQKVLDGIDIQGDNNFKEKTTENLRQIYNTETGKKLLNEFANSGKKIIIKPTTLDNGLTKDLTIWFNPEFSPGVPPAIVLAHELIHAYHNMTGTNESDIIVPNDGTDTETNKEEAKTVGFPPYEGEPYTENKIRNEFDPPLPPRDSY